MKPVASPHGLPSAADISRVVLPNGITLLSRPNFNSPSVVLSGYIEAGSLFEPDEKLGLADFTASCLMRGTEARDFQEIYDALESAGASLGFSSGTHSTGFSGRALVEDLPLLFDLLAESLRQAVFPPDHVERLRAQLLTGLSIRAQDTGDMASLAFDELIFAGHPYRRPDDGWPETIRAINREDILAYYRDFYGPKGMVIAVVGAVDASRVYEQAMRALGDWENPRQPAPPGLPPLRPLAATERRHITIPGKAQTDLVLGVAGPKRRDPDYLPALLANSVLGQFGMMGRIGDVVRERSGLAYYAYSSLSAGTGPGAWEISAGVNPANLERALALILDELRGFVEKGVTQEELQDSQDNFVGRLPLSLESNGGVANALVSIERYQFGLDYYQSYEARVRSVTPEQVLRAIRKYIEPDRLAIASAGAA
jgi:zinc protease